MATTNIYDKTNNRNIGDIDLETLLANVWVNANLNGTSDVSWGVSSLTDVGTGKIGVSFTIPFTNTNFIAMVTPQVNNAATMWEHGQNTTNLSSSRSDFYLNTAGGTRTPTDPVEWNIQVLGAFPT